MVYRYMQAEITEKAKYYQFDTMTTFEDALARKLIFEDQLNVTLTLTTL